MASTFARRHALTRMPLGIVAAMMAFQIMTANAAAAADPAPPAAHPACSWRAEPAPFAAAACLSSEMAPTWSSGRGRPGEPY